MYVLVPINVRLYHKSGYAFRTRIPCDSEVAAPLVSY